MRTILHECLSCLLLPSQRHECEYLFIYGILSQQMQVGQWLNAVLFHEKKRRRKYFRVIYNIKSKYLRLTFSLNLCSSKKKSLCSHLRWNQKKKEEMALGKHKTCCGKKRNVQWTRVGGLIWLMFIQFWVCSDTRVKNTALRFWWCQTFHSVTRDTEVEKNGSVLLVSAIRISTP